MQLLINGEHGKEIMCKKDLRQGDPLSPLLFVLVAEGLNNMIRKAKQGGLLSRLSTAPHTTFINLQYVDDTIMKGIMYG